MAEKYDVTAILPTANVKILTRLPFVPQEASFDFVSFNESCPEQCFRSMRCRSETEIVNLAHLRQNAIAFVNRCAQNCVRCKDSATDS